MKNKGVSVLTDFFRNSVLFFVSMAFVAFAFGKEGSPKESALTVVTGPATNGGIIKGVVRFPDEYPERYKITVTKDQAICGAFKYSGDFVVSEDTHGLKNVVISLLGIEADEELAAKTITLAQTKCTYVPHVQIAPVGSMLQILNTDGILHNVHAYFDGVEPKNTVFNKAQPKFLKKLSQKLEQVGTYFFKCDVHSHMSAFVTVVNHPFHTITGELGEFEMANVPAGTYTIQARHEVLGILEKQVTVISGKTADVSFDILPNE